jgi:mitochondrial import receptor subunit TOM40
MYRFLTRDLNVVSLQLMLIGRLSPDGRVNARVKCDLTENLALKINAQVICL